MTTTRQALMNGGQFNTPIKMYSAENVQDTLSKQTQVLANGALGIDFNQLTAHAPGNLANSAVLRMLEEEAQRGGKENTRFEHATPRRRVQRFDWPPRAPSEYDVDNTTEYEQANDNDNDGNGGGGGNNINNLCNKRNINRNINNVNRFNGFQRNINRTYHFNSTTCHIYTSPGLKRVAWPPLPETQNNIIEKTLVYPQEPVTNNPLSPQQTTPQYQHQQQQQQHQQQQDQPPVWSPTPVAAPLLQEPVFQRIVQAPAPVFEPPPTFVTLRSSAPISQETAPVFESQPAATRGLGPRMRGDQKWPPAEQKAQAVEENLQRQALAKGPAVRPRAVKKDYSKFFAQHALTTTYPGYRAPPGTQHYVEEGTSNF